MKVIVLPMRGGKTTKIIEQLKQEPNAVLFVLNSQIRNYIIHTFADLEIDGGRSCTFANRIKVIGRDNLLGTNKYALIDNADMVLENLVRGRVKTCTVTRL